MQWTMQGLLEELSASGGSDLIVTAGATPQLRVLGALQPLPGEVLSAEDTAALARSVLTEEQARRFEVEKSLDFSRGFDQLSRFRFNVFHQRDAVALVARIIPFRVPGFESLGLPDIIKTFALRPHGLVLITGPAGSGKSTTLAAMIEYINTNRQVHVIAIEDPIEYLHLHRQSIIEQREIGADARTFGEALRTVFRQSPDVIMVGEMRDLETMQLALTLAETGHLILATLHTQDTTHSVNRIVDMFPPDQQQQVYAQLALVLEGVVSQQLIPTLDHTRRVLAYEVLRVNPAVRNLVREAQVQQLLSVIQTGREEGMVTMNDSLARLCLEGLIDPNTALRRSPRPKEFARLWQRHGGGAAPAPEGKRCKARRSEPSCFAPAG